MIRCVKHKATATRLCKGLSVALFYTMPLAMPCFGQQGWVKSINSGAAMTRFWNGLTSANNNYYFQAAPFAGVQIARVINNTLTLAGELNYDIINSITRAVAQAWVLFCPGITSIIVSACVTLSGLQISR